METTKKVKPIKPSEMVQTIPDWIIEGANECIQEHWVELEKQSHFTQDELIKFVLKHKPEEDRTTRAILFQKHWLDIEPIYRKEGWKVEYDKPAYCESYEPNFTFSVE